MSGAETRKAGTKIANKGKVSSESGKKALHESLDKLGKLGADEDGAPKSRESGTKKKTETVQEKAVKELQKTIKEFLVVCFLDIVNRYICNIYFQIFYLYT